MSSVVIYRTQEGKLAGLDERGHRQYEKFKRTVAAMEPGDTMQFDYRLPRSPKHHGLFFAKVHGLFEMTEAFSNEDDLRLWLLVGAGYCHYLPGTDGQLVAVPQSLNWCSLEEVDFIEVHRRVDAFLWELRARHFLWPQLSDEVTYRTIEGWRHRFDMKERKVRTIAPAAIEIGARVVA